MGILQSNEGFYASALYSHKLISRGYIELYHFGEVELFQEENTQQLFFRNSYEFILEADTESEFLLKLQKQNN
jgi:hypothetical protein